MIRTVLIDDEIRLLSSLQTMLKRNCPQLEVVALCRSADEALIKIKETNPDLIFLDIAMPGKDGFALLSEIGDIHFHIIFVSAHDEYSLRAFKFSTVDYLLKPVAEDEMIAAVKKAEQTIFQEQTLRKSTEALMHNPPSPRQIRAGKETLFGHFGRISCGKPFGYCLLRGGRALY